MRDYQRKKGNRHILPRAVYHQALWQIRDYYRLKAQLRDILDASPNPPDGMPRGTGRKDEVPDKAIKRAAMHEVIRLIDESMKKIPEEYRKGVWDNIHHGRPFPKDAHRTTYGRHKSKFIFSVAKGLFLI